MAGTEYTMVMVMAMDFHSKSCRTRV